MKRVFAVFLFPLLLALFLACGGDDATSTPVAATAAATVAATPADTPPSTPAPTPEPIPVPMPTATATPATPTATPTPVATAGPPTPSPTTVPTPEPTPEVTPTPEPTPEPTPTPGPQLLGNYELFEDPEIGIRFRYPEFWRAQKQASEFVWMRAIDPMVPDSRLLMFTLFHDLDTPLSDRLDDAVEIFVREEVQEGLTPEVEYLDPVTLLDGSDALRANVTHGAGPNTTVLHRMQVSMRTTFTYVLIFSAFDDEAERWSRTFESMLSSLETFEPAIYGVSHDRAFIMLLGEPQIMDPALVRGDHVPLICQQCFQWSRPF